MRDWDAIFAARYGARIRRFFLSTLFPLSLQYGLAFVLSYVVYHDWILLFIMPPWLLAMMFSVVWIVGFSFGHVYGDGWVGKERKEVP